jgi:hypothetical protein
VYLKKSDQLYNHVLKQYTKYSLFSTIYYYEDEEGGTDSLTYLLIILSFIICMDGGTDTPQIICHFVMCVNKSHLMTSYYTLCHLMSSYVILCHHMSSYVILYHSRVHLQHILHHTTTHIGYCKTFKLFGLCLSFQCES